MKKRATNVWAKSYYIWLNDVTIEEHGYAVILYTWARNR